MAVLKRPAAKKQAPASKKLAKKTSEPNDSEQPAKLGPYESQHAKSARFEVSIGKTDDGRTLEEFIEAVRTVLKAGPVGANNVTYLGGHYIIDGKVCMPEDYDPETKNRKPGTTPPPWAGGPDPAKPKASHEAVHNEPTKAKPLTKPAAKQLRKTTIEKSPKKTMLLAKPKKVLQKKVSAR